MKSTVSENMEICHPQGQTVIIWTFVFVSVIGIIGNSFSIHLLSIDKLNRRTEILSPAYRIYIIALAAADIGMLLNTGILRYAVVDYFYETGKSMDFYNIYLCRWHRLLMHASHNASVWILVIMAFERYFAVRYPFKYRTMKQDTKKAKKVVFVILFISVLFATPFLATGPVYRDNVSENESSLLNFTSYNFTSETISVPATANTFDSDTAISQIEPTVISNSSIHGDEQMMNGRLVVECSLTATISEELANVLNIAFHMLWAFLFPCVFLLVLVFATLRYLSFRTRRASRSCERRRRNRKITVTMLVVCSTHVVLWLPQTVMLLANLDAHSHNCSQNEIATSLAALSGISSSAINFVLYSCTVKRFRFAAWNKLRRLMCCVEAEDTDMLHQNSIKVRFSAYPSLRNKSILSHKRSSPSLRRRQDREFKVIEGGYRLDDRAHLPTTSVIPECIGQETRRESLMLNVGPIRPITENLH